LTRPEEETRYERKKRREESLLELGFALIILAAIVGSSAFFFYLIPAHPEVCTGLSLVAWIAIFFIVGERSSNRKMRHDEEIREAYSRGQLEARREDT
jgi:putative Mn2+ efflux pump MntP